MAELGNVPGKEGSHESRAEERRVSCSCGFGARLGTPLLPPFHLLFDVPQGHAPWTGPRNQGVRTRLRGRKGGNKKEERPSQKKEKY